MPGSDKRVWWRCEFHRHHVWEAVINKRALQGTGCPLCRDMDRKRKRRRKAVRVPQRLGLG